MSTIRSAETGLRCAHARFGSCTIGHAMSSAGTPEGLCSSERLVLHRWHCATSTTVTYSAWRCYLNTTWRTRARETCVLLTSSAGSSRTRRPGMSTAACRPRPRALAALLPMNSTLVHEGILAGCAPPQNDPTKGRARVGVGESERTRTRAPPQQSHYARLLPPPQARSCS